MCSVGGRKCEGRPKQQGLGLASLPVGSCYGLQEAYWIVMQCQELCFTNGSVRKDAFSTLKSSPSEYLCHGAGGKLFLVTAPEEPEKP